jgi:hypothetical protein
VVTHEAERSAVRFLGSDMGSDEREAFSRHLLTCAPCRDEVDGGRRGRALAESLRTAAPVELRDRVRGLVEAESLSRARTARARRPRGRWLVPVGVPAAAAAAIVLVVAVGRGPTEPPALREAVADYTAQELPGSQLPSQEAPDLSALGMRPVGAGAGTYAGLAVDGYAYQDLTGRRIVVYLSDDPFPEAPGAQLLAGQDGPWVAQRGDVTVLCARYPHALLVVGQDDALVRTTADRLGAL